jgi:hypothetical protein
MFTGEGHLDISARDFLTAARADVRKAVNDFMLGGTPRAFTNYGDYCKFLRELGYRLHVHPRSIVIRGSTLLGYSTSPKRDKVWKKMRDGLDGSRPSDIDVAIVDVDYYDRMDNEATRWDARQGVPALSTIDSEKYLRRRSLRRYYCCDDHALPPGTCVPHHDVLESFDTAPFCGVRRPLSAFVFRDWWGLRGKAELDIRELCDKIDRDQLPEPP